VILGKLVEGAGLKLTIMEEITWERIHFVSFEITIAHSVYSLVR
jgi:hypothetical protein